MRPSPIPGYGWHGDECQKPGPLPYQGWASVHDVMAIRASPACRLSHLSLHSHAPPGVFSVLTRRVYPGCAPPGLSVSPGESPGEFSPLTPGAPERPLGPPATLIAGLTWIGLSCIFISVYPRLAWVIVLWTLKTLGLAAAIPPQKALISDLTAHAQRGTGYGLSTFAASLGAAVGPLLGGLVYDSVGHDAVFSHRHHLPGQSRVGLPPVAAALARP